MASTALTRVVATFGFVGLLRPAPGTWGSLAAIVLAVPMVSFGGAGALVMGAVTAFALGLWATEAEVGPGDHDPSFIVIDEVAGQWIAALPLAALTPQVILQDVRVIGWFGVSFLLFRLFDIWKPWPVSWADRRSDALGVMLDDVLAGAMAAAVLAVLIFAVGP
ncbi:MAG: phosphatidylglycerophosphatase A [Pseudomonadota bacterium]